MRDRLRVDTAVLGSRGASLPQRPCAPAADRRLLLPLPLLPLLYKSQLAPLRDNPGGKEERVGP